MTHGVSTAPVRAGARPQCAPPYPQAPGSAVPLPTPVPSSGSCPTVPSCPSGAHTHHFERLHVHRLRPALQVPSTDGKVGAAVEPDDGLFPVRNQVTGSGLVMGSQGGAIRGMGVMCKVVEGKGLAPVGREAMQQDVP